MSRYHHGDVRRAATDALVDRVRRDGPAGVTIRAIAGDVGVSHAALYRHVTSVDELLDDAAARFLLSLVEDARPDEPVEVFLRRYVERALDDPQWYRLAFARAAATAGRAPVTAEALTTLRDHAGAVFAHAWPDDTPRATMHRVLRTWSTVHGMLDLSGLGLVVTTSPASLRTYLVESALRSARAG